MNAIAMFTLDLIRVLKPKLRGWHLKPLAAVKNPPPIVAYRPPKGVSDTQFFIEKAEGSLAYILCRKPKSRLRLLSLLISDYVMDFNGIKVDGGGRCFISYYSVNGWRQNEFKMGRGRQYSSMFNMEYDPALAYYSRTAIFHLEAGAAKRDNTARIIPAINFGDPGASEQVSGTIAAVLLKSFDQKDPRVQLHDYDDCPLAVFLGQKNRLLKDTHNIRLDIRVI